MEQYFFKLSQSYSAKNKMDEEIKDFLYSLDGTLITDGLEVFQDHLQAKINEIHTRHSRCKPIDLRIWGSAFDSNRGIKDLAVACGCSTGKIYEVKRHFQI